MAYPDSARVTVDPQRVIAPVPPLLFGSFLEHLGRCIYGGVYEPTSPHADANGFRRDVLTALRELSFTILRYPGGNYVSACDWKDGIGPKSDRPRRRELAWHSIETNQFGTDEFLTFCRELSAEPMLGLNFGTGSIQSAGELVEYCNAPLGTAWADRRAANGHPEPYGVKYWCLGNEMDGPWQIGQMSADAYGIKAREAAKLMRRHDPSLQLIACGSSSSDMPTYPQWDRVVLEHCYDQVDFLSMHHYAGNRDNNTADYLAYPLRLQNHIDTMAATLRYVKEKQRSSRSVKISFDEWNVWYRARGGHGAWQEAPHLLEEIYNLEDALLVAQWISLMLRKSDVVTMACLAQAVNAIAPILTIGDQLVRQSIFYPFQLFRRHAIGQVLDLAVTSPRYDSAHGDADLLDGSATFDPATGAGALFLVNRSLTQALPVTLQFLGDDAPRIRHLYTLGGPDPKAFNSIQHPAAVVPRMLGSQPVVDQRARLLIPPLTLMVVVTEMLPRGATA